MNMMLAGPADLPDAVIGLLPALGDRKHHAFGEAQVFLRESRSLLGLDSEQFRYGTQHVKLDLVSRAVAHAHRSATPISCQFRNDAFRAEVTTGDSVERANQRIGLTLFQQAENPI